jgi:hypothetical protein
VLLNFILDLFDLKSDEIDEKNYKHAMIAVNGPRIIEKSHFIQLLSSGYVKFIQVYDVLNGFIFTFEFDENKNLTCHTSQTHFPAAENLGTFFHDLGVLFVSCLSVWEVHPEHINCSTGDQ